MIFFLFFFLMRMQVLDLLIFDSASPLLYLTLLLFLSYFFSLTPDSLFLKTSLSISPKVPSDLHHHVVALGSCPKFQILSPDEIRISVWNHTVNSFGVGGMWGFPCFSSFCSNLGQNCRILCIYVCLLV